MVQKLNKLMESFIWNGRRPKISLKKLQNEKIFGGMELVDFRNKDMSLKASLVAQLADDDDLAHLAYLAINPILSESIWNCYLKPEDAKYVCTGFWSDVLEAWCTYNWEPNDHTQKPLWYNSSIRINGKPFFG